LNFQSTYRGRHRLANATKRSIGGSTDENQHIDSHEIHYKTGDTFYIFSDGYADTFGGAENKKLTTKRFKDLLITIQSQPMLEQEVHLGRFIEDRKDNYEQTDDILVVGFRL
jgi:serine phosphatase RsbU (regulator of sigma subunit)